MKYKNNVIILIATTHNKNDNFLDFASSLHSLIFYD